MTRGVAQGRDDRQKGKSEEVKDDVGVETFSETTVVSCGSKKKRSREGDTKKEQEGDTTHSKSCQLKSCQLKSCQL